MTEAVEVAIEIALLKRAQDFATSQGLDISLPNVSYTPPSPDKNAKYLRATILPADTAMIGINSSSHDRHYGFLQLDVICGAGAGEISPGRIAAAVISYFKRDTLMTSNGFGIRVNRTPFRGPQTIKDAWATLPVRIPYETFAIPV